MKVTKYKKAEKEGYLIASFSVAYQVPRYGTMFCNDIQLFQKDGRRWIAFPQRKYEKDGEVQFFAYTGCTDRLGAEAFRSDALDAIELFCIEAQIDIPENKIKPKLFPNEKFNFGEMENTVHVDNVYIPINAQKPHQNASNEVNPYSINALHISQPEAKEMQVSLPF